MCEHTPLQFQCEKCKDRATCQACHGGPEERADQRSPSQGDDGSKQPLQRAQVRIRPVLLRLTRPRVRALPVSSHSHDVLPADRHKT